MYWFANLRFITHFPEFILILQFPVKDTFFCYIHTSIICLTNLPCWVLTCPLSICLLTHENQNLTVLMHAFIYLWVSDLSSKTLLACYRGDYRTGKRLNMRKVIAYIASEFRKDKIWLRRTKPSKRQYQIMVAVDDSSSMVDNHSKQVTNRNQCLYTVDGEKIVLLCRSFLYYKTYFSQLAPK